MSKKTKKEVAPDLVDEVKETLPKEKNGDSESKAKVYILDITKVNTIDDVRVILHLLRINMPEGLYNTSSQLVRQYFTEVKNSN